MQRPAIVFTPALIAMALSLVLLPRAASADPLVPIADAKRGTFVTLEGEVTRILDEDTFRLSDETGRIRVYIGPNRMPVRPGERVSLTGFVDDDFGPREVYAETLTAEDGEAFIFERGYD
jgi:uncharacterized protein YdeI (BOF family)